jgi:Tol biopolymer transport system component
MDLERGTTIPLKGLPDTCCVGWSADSTRLVVSAQRGLGTSELYLLPADGTRAAERVAASPPDSFPQSWSPDGKFLLFRTLDLTQGGVHWSLLTTPMPGQALATLFAKDASAAKFSPDGLWVAYTSAESDRPEVFVQAFPSGPRVPVTSRGGDSPSWTGDGSEILYHSQDKIMAVAVKRSAGPRIEIGTARALFDQPPGSGYWELARDGQRILIQVPFGPKPAQLPLTVVVNWTEGLKK